MDAVEYVFIQRVFHVLLKPGVIDFHRFSHCARGSCVRISSGRGQPRWAEVSRGQPRWAEVSRGGPRWAEVSRAGPRWAEVSRGGPRSAEVGRGQPIMTKLLKSY